jgi:hypothetical protein
MSLSVLILTLEDEARIEAYHDSAAKRDEIADQGLPL